MPNTTLVEATIYDNITEENGRGEVLDTLRALRARVAYMEALNKDYADALRKIAQSERWEGAVASAALKQAQS